MKKNMKSGEEYEYTPGECRNTKHKDIEFQHTAKTATSLLPPEPEYMMVFGDDMIGYLWDIDACDLKDERYVWETDGGSDACYWISPNPTNFKPEDVVPVAPISRLRENNLEAVKEKKTIWWNELDIGLPKRRIDAMFASRDTLELRLRAWNQMLRDKKRLQFVKDIPLFVIQSDREDGLGAVFRVYGASERVEDLKAANAILQNPPGDMSTYKVALLRAVVNGITAELNPKIAYHGMLFKLEVKTEKTQLLDAIERGIKKLDEEINSCWPYPNKDRKLLKLDAHKKINELIDKPLKLLTYITMLEKERSSILQGFFSTRTRDLVMQAKQWAESEMLKQTNSQAMLSAAP